MYESANSPFTVFLFILLNTQQFSLLPNTQLEMDYFININ